MSAIQFTNENAGILFSPIKMHESDLYTQLLTREKFNAATALYDTNKAYLGLWQKEKGVTRGNLIGDGVEVLGLLT